MTLDARCLALFQGHHTLFLTQMAKGMSALTTSKVCCLWAAIIAGALIYHHRFIRGSIVFFGTALSAALVEILKMSFARSRPPLSGVYDSYSFPSGHALTNTVFFGLAARALGRQYPAYRKTFYGLAVIPVLLIGWSRLYLGVHWPSDVLGGFLIGFLFLSGWLWLNDRYCR